MPRLIKKTVVLAKVETTQYTDAVPTGAANAIQVMDLSITPVDAKTVNLNTVTPWFGGSVDLVTVSAVKCSFSVLMAGSGTAATPPAWGQLLLGCAHSETLGLTVPNRCEYSPATDNTKSLTIYWYDHDGLHKLLGAQGTVKLSAKSGEVPKFMFEFTGIDGVMTNATNPTAVLTAWKIPPAVTKANVVDVMLGGTLTAGALAGTSINSTGLTLDWGNQVAFTPMLTQEQIILSDRDLKGTVQFDLTAAQEVTQIANVKSNFLQSLGFQIGNVAGNSMVIFLPAVQLLNPKKDELNGMRLISFDFHAWPVAGNDEIKIVTK